jgi:hypothetical protein
MKTPLLLVAATTMALAQAPSDAIPNTDDIEVLVRQFIATGSGTKSEFETTAQFEARIKQGSQAGRRYAFVHGSSDSFAYDADKGVMTASTLPLDSRLSIKEVLRSTDSKVGQNSYGARTDFLSSVYDEFGIVLSKASISWLNVTILEDIKLSFPLSIDRAQEIKPYLRMVLVGTVPDTQVYRDEGYSAATVSNPIEKTLHWLYINFDITEVRIVDARTGNEVAKFTSTYAGPHRIGETFQKWLAINHMNMADICQKNHKGDHSMDFKAVCKKLSALRDTGHGEFYTVDDARRGFGWIFIDGKVAEIRPIPPGRQE